VGATRKSEVGLEACSLHIGELITAWLGIEHLT
jgi:hypothetical protein